MNENKHYKLCQIRQILISEQITIHVNTKQLYYVYLF